MSDKTNELVDRIEREHQRVSLYRDAELYCPWIDDEEHEENRHMQAESFSSSIICLDLPAGEGCETCSTDNLCESLELLDEVKRLQTELKTAKAEAWDEGYSDKDSEPSEAMIERGLRERATNPYREESS